MKIGVLAAQGAFAEHIWVLKKLGVEASEVRLPRELDSLDGIIIPGGESTSIAKLMLDYRITDKLRDLIKKGLPAFGTCAGAILLAKNSASERLGAVVKSAMKEDLVKARPERLGVMDICVRRNAFGRQVDSFETDLAIPVLGKKLFHAVFIRAPLIESVTESKVEVLAKLPDGTIVAARQGKMLVAAFHPELTDDLRFHQYFLDIVSGKR
jgi:5'-phosphate synthase pdxT subunit